MDGRGCEGLNSDGTETQNKTRQDTPPTWRRGRSLEREWERERDKSARAADVSGKCCQTLEEC